MCCQGACILLEHVNRCEHLGEQHTQHLGESKRATQTHAGTTHAPRAALHRQRKEGGIKEEDVDRSVTHSPPVCVYACNCNLQLY